MPSDAVSSTSTNEESPKSAGESDKTAKEWNLRDALKDFDSWAENYFQGISDGNGLQYIKFTVALSLGILTFSEQISALGAPVLEHVNFHISLYFSGHGRTSLSYTFGKPKMISVRPRARRMKHQKGLLLPRPSSRDVNVSFALPEADSGLLIHSRRRRLHLEVPLAHPWHISTKIAESEIQ